MPCRSVPCRAMPFRAVPCRASTTCYCDHRRQLLHSPAFPCGTARQVVRHEPFHAAQHGRWYGTSLPCGTAQQVVRHGTAERNVRWLSTVRHCAALLFSGPEGLGVLCTVSTAESIVSAVAAFRQHFGRLSAFGRRQPFGRLCFRRWHWPQGVGTAASLSDALEWYRKSAAQNCAGAQPQH
jgi:hypothetical protein